MSIKNLYPDMPVVDIMNARQKWLEKYAPYFECENAVEQLPSVNPQEPKTGHWIEIAQYSDGKHKIECSECGSHIFDRGHANSFNVKNKYKYCPNCGCRMVEPQESEDKCKNCEYYYNPDYTRCHECKAGSEDKE